MSPEKFTVKLQEAFNAAQSIATRYGQQELQSAHLLLAVDFLAADDDVDLGVAEGLVPAEAALDFLLEAGGEAPVILRERRYRT